MGKEKKCPVRRGRRPLNEVSIRPDGGRKRKKRIPRCPISASHFERKGKTRCAFRAAKGRKSTCAGERGGNTKEWGKGYSLVLLKKER